MMSRDYKTPVRNGQKKSGNPLLIGLILGVLLGLLLAGGTIALFTSLLKPFEQKNPPPAVQSENIPSVNKPVEGEAQQTDSPKLDFYTILPQKTVIPPGQPQASAPPSITPPNKDSSSQKSIYLQAGAYRNKNEASNIKARLALLGVESDIESVTLPDGSVWHRVRIGPIDGSAKLKSLRQLLTKNNITTTIINETNSN